MFIRITSCAPEIALRPFTQPWHLADNNTNLHAHMTDKHHSTPLLSVHFSALLQLQRGTVTRLKTETKQTLTDRISRLYLSTSKET